MLTHSLCLQIIRPYVKWAVSLVITDGHFIFLRGLCGYACVSTLSMIYWLCWTKTALRMIAYLTILLTGCFTFWFKKTVYIYSFEIVVFGNNFCHIYGHVDLGHTGL